MKKKYFFVSVVFLLTVLFIFSSIAAAAEVKDKVYKCLNPQGSYLPVNVQGLAPRIDTIVGKTIYIHQGEADPVIMPALFELVQKAYPKTNWKYIGHSDFGPSAPEDEVLAEADAIIKGVAW